MAEKEGLKNDERFLASVELVVVVYQMIGDLENAVTYSGIHAGAIRGSKRSVTLRRHWKDLCSYRGFHECAPWWGVKARLVDSPKNSWDEESFEELFDFVNGGVHLEALIAQCVHTMISKVQLLELGEKFTPMVVTLRDTAELLDPEMDYLFRADRSELEDIRFLTIKTGFLLVSGGTGVMDRVTELLLRTGCSVY